MRKIVFIALIPILVLTGCLHYTKRGNDMSDKIRIKHGDKKISYIDFIKQLSHYDVIFIGEKHDDPNAHLMEIRIAQDLYKLNPGNFAISMEMFERDVQNVLNDYLKGKIDEKTFLAKSRPWSNYPTDYKPIIEFAKKNHIDVLASNIPRHFANMVAMRGMDIYDKLKKENKNKVAEHVDTLEPEYKNRFINTMKMVSRMGKMNKMNVENFYYAQCTKDNTMAESINNYIKTHPNNIILMINGSFHSDFGLGIPYRLKKLNDSLKIAIVKVKSPGEDIEKGQCDYLIIPNK